MDINRKHLLIIDSILIFGILISIFLLVGYSQPLVIAPLPSEEGSLLFYLPKTDFIILDDNSRFDSASTIFAGEQIELQEGRYFIKFFDGSKGEIRQIDIQLRTTLEFKLIDNRMGVFNKGDRAINVETYDKGSLIGSSIAYSGEGDE